MASPKTEDDLDSAQPNLHFQPADSADEDTKEELNDLFAPAYPCPQIPNRPESSAPSELADHDDRLSSPERRHREQMEYAEEDQPEPFEEHKREADLPIPNIPVPKSSDGSYWVIRIPNFIKVDSKPFHPDTYVGPEQEDEDAHHAESLREKSMTIKLKVENTLRWRWSKDEFNQDRRQSNSRIVRWSDGTLSLQLGKELFDITQSIDTSGAVSRQALGSTGAPTPSLSQSQSLQNVPSLSQPQSQPVSGASASQHAQGLTYLVAQHKRAEILQCEALVTGYMSLRPTGMQSETHRMLVRAVGQKHSRVARLRMAPDPTFDPEREKLELAKAAARKPRKSRGGAGEEDGFGGPRRRRSYTRKRTGDGMWSDDDDDDDDVGFGRGGSEDEYGEDLSGRKGKRKKSADENGKKGPGEYQTDDFLVADSDEDGDFADEDAGRRKRKRAAREDADAEEDDLDKLEAKISQNEAQERKRRQRDGDPGTEDAEAGADSGGEDAMDVESEDDDDDFGVRRSRGTSGRKRRVIGMEEEEDE
ncbi:Leo1-like protein-domain-containing protein [Daedaleopsis nitida]|nr:Leo1-like protein-domain-containing protein [Daedaleopsis nitida]